MNNKDNINNLKDQSDCNNENKTEMMIDHLGSNYEDDDDYDSYEADEDDYIPEPPITTPELYQKYVIPNFIRCGAIPKDKLVVGKTYFGSCRNADKAIWLGDKFEYTRHKFGASYQEKINHFEDDDGFDLFVPIREINSE